MEAVTSAHRLTVSTLFWLLVILTLLAAVDECSGKCFSFMGIATCSAQEGVDAQFPFTPEWWFVNVHRRESLIRVMKEHLVDGTFIGRTVQIAPSLGAANELLANDDLWDLFDQTVAYLREVKGEPTELLFDETVGPMDLYRSYRLHTDDILDLMSDVLERGGYSPELERNVARYQSLIREASQTLNAMPEITDNSFFKIMEQGAYAAHANQALQASMSNFVKLASNLIAADNKS